MTEGQYTLERLGYAGQDREQINRMFGELYQGKADADHSHEKLDRLPDAETSQRVVYVSPNGIDSGSGTGSAPWKTIQYAVNQARVIMQPVNGTSAYKVVCADGTYDGNVVIPPNLLAAFNSSGGGGIWITSASQLSASVKITASAGSCAVQAFGYCSLDFLTLEHDSRGVLADGGPAVYAYTREIVFQRRSNSSGGVAAIHARQGSQVFSYNNSSVAGRLFGYGLQATNGAVIAKGFGQPSGITANESMTNGAVIR